MAVSIVVPPLGESIVEGTIVKWLKKEGEKVGKDEPVVEIMTDKINVELPAPEEGILIKILQQEGSVVPIGTRIGVLNGEGAKELIASASLVQVEVKEEEPLTVPSLVSASVGTESSRTRSSPAVRRLAKEFRINVDEVSGTGAGGRVTREDLLEFVEKRKGVHPAPS